MYALHEVVHAPVAVPESYTVAENTTLSVAAPGFLANDSDCYAASCALLGDADLRPFLQTFRMPVAIMVGEEDQATPKEIKSASESNSRPNGLSRPPIRATRPSNKSKMQASSMKPSAMVISW